MKEMIDGRRGTERERKRKRKRERGRDRERKIERKRQREREREKEREREREHTLQKEVGERRKKAQLLSIPFKKSKTQYQTTPNKRYHLLNNIYIYIIPH